MTKSINQSHEDVYIGLFTRKFHINQPYQKVNIGLLHTPQLRILPSSIITLSKSIVVVGQKDTGSACVPATDRGRVLHLLTSSRMS
jgi:hypothetical protein